MQNNTLWKSELEMLVAIISKQPLQKTMKWGSEVFTFNDKNVVSYGGFKNYFALWFYNGVFMRDKYKVLINAQEGKTKSLRQWRFTSKEEIKEKKILEYVKEAIEIEKKGLSIPPSKFTPVPVPDLLRNEFKKNKSLQEKFKNLTPGKQKEYIVYINEAKQDQTKLNRLEKMKPMIWKGIGLNDRYR